MSSPLHTPHLFVISQDNAVAESLSHLVQQLLGEKISHSFNDSHVILAHSAEQLHSQLDSFNARQIMNSVCIVDVAKGSEWKIKKSEDGLRPAELILQYPEVYWIFLVGSCPITKSSEPGKFILAKKNHFLLLEELSGLQELLVRHAAGFRTWFDPTGLRAMMLGVKQNPKYGIAIDDEVNFTVFNGYVTYRYGYSTFVVASKYEMGKVLGKDCNSGDIRKVSPKTLKIIEDIQLNFLDLSVDNVAKGEPYLLKDSQCKENQEGNLTKKLLETRANSFCMKPCGNVERIFVTIGSNNTNDDFPDKAIHVTKPYGGIFDKDLSCRLINSKSESEIDNNIKVQQHNHAHSVGDSRMQHVANLLLERARSFAKQADSPIMAVHAALLAREARILLDKKNCPAVSLECLAIQHRMEVVAECTFFGLSSFLDSKKRIQEIEKSIFEIVGDSEHKKYNALCQTLDDIRLIYKKHDQLEEERITREIMRQKEWQLQYLDSQQNNHVVKGICTRAQCLVTLKEKVQNRFLLNDENGIKKFYNRFLIFFLNQLKCEKIIQLIPFTRGYYAFHAKNIASIGGWSCGWIVFFTLLFCFGDTFCFRDEHIDIIDWFIFSFSNFIDPGASIVNPPTLSCWNVGGGTLSRSLVLVHPFGYYFFNFLSLLENLIGITHLGVFISYMFQKISRT